MKIFVPLVRADNHCVCFGPVSSVLIVEQIKLAMCAAGDMRSTLCLCIHVCGHMCVCFEFLSSERRKSKYQSAKRRALAVQEV